MSVQRAPGRHTASRVIGRFLAGRPLDGNPRTNATWLHRSYGPHADLTHHGRASRWHHAPGWHRSAWRIGGLLMALGIAYACVIGYQELMTALRAAGAVLLVLITWRIWRTFTIGKHNRQLVKPLYRTVAPIIGHPPGDSPHRFLTVPYKFRTMKNPVITLELSPHWEGTVNDQKRVHALISRRLGGDWRATWYHHVSPPRLEITPAPQPPERVNLADMLPALAVMKTGTLFIGYGTERAVLDINLDDESPHVAITAGTGGGKTALLRLIIAQLKRQRCERIDIIDPKRVSHNWAKGISGVFIHRTMREQMQAIRDFRTCMEARYDRLDANPDEIFPRRALIIEEQNSFMGYAQTYWDDARREASPADRIKMPRKNPAIADIGFCLFQGRQACMNIISVFQRMSAGAAGGGDLRENYGCKILARFSPQTWKILVGTTPVPRCSRKSGRAMYVLGEDYRAVQIGYLREAKEKDWPGQPRGNWRDEAREYAMAGTVPADMPPAGPESPAPGLISLREATDTRVLPMRYGAASKARQRDPRFPAGQESPAGRVYDPTALRAWHGTRGQKTGAII
jgi:hypothetical protein